MDRVFPALTQTEMQLACMHTLKGALSEDDPMLDELQMPQTSTATAAPAPSNGNSQADNAPDWLQQQDKLDGWMLQNLKDGQRRLKLVKALTQMALPFQYGNSRVVQALGDMYSENVS